jgi:hypothetical protein
MAVVKPLSKLGNKTRMTNDRPVSVLTVFSKVLEKGLHSILSQHLHTNILVTELCGLRKGISSEDAAFRLADSVFKSINQKMHDGRIFWNLAKAFDCVNHEIWFAEFHFYGIGEVPEDWFRSF